MTQPDSPAASPDEIIAPPGRYYRNARYIIFILCIFAGAWFSYDGWVAWPRQNLEDIQSGQRLHHPSAYDIPLQKGLGIALPLLGIGILALMFHASRGQYRLAGNVLYIPGHPPIPFNSIKTIDKTRWDRKGIALIDYELPTGRQGQLILDDFHYQQDPTDEILKRIEAHIQELAGEMPPAPADSEA
jgi:hypothetical protein